jgi:hypothetical protein
VVLVTGDLHGLDGSSLLGVEVGEHGVQFFGIHFLGDFADEDVAGFVGLGQVASEESVVKRKTSALLSFDFEVAEHLASLRELLLIVDAHDGTVEGLGGVSAHLGFVLKLNSMGFEEFSESG